MILSKPELLNTFSLLMKRHEITIKTLTEKSKIEILSDLDKDNLSRAHSALETYKISQNKMVQNWIK